MTQEYLKSKYKYCEETGVFTKISSGKTTTYVTSTGYKRVVIDKKHYREHKLAWLYVYGTFPEGIIDHKNRIKTDNRIINLRIVTHSENQLNVNLQKKQ